MTLLSVGLPRLGTRAVDLAASAVSMPTASVVVASLVDSSGRGLTDPMMAWLIGVAVLGTLVDPLADGDR